MKNKMNVSFLLQILNSMKDTVQKSCPTGPIVTVVDGGRFGNKIWMYAVVWSMAQLLDRPGFIPKSLLESLNGTFADLSLRSLEEIEHCNLTLGDQVNKQKLLPLDKVKETFQGQHMLLQQWILFPEPILQFRSRLKKELRFTPQILRDVEATVARIGGRGRTRVGIHVRRTNYAGYLNQAHFNSPLVQPSYFHVSNVHIA
jgi:hypothetical protein